MEKIAIVAGTAFENHDGSSRSEIIRKYVKNNQTIYLRRESSNDYDENAIAVYICVPKLFGMFGASLKQIGYIKAGTAKSLAKKIDSGEQVNAFIKSYYAPPEKDDPRVTLRLEY